MSFNKAESLAATSGYFKWVADTKSYHEAAAKQARRPKKFRHKSAHDAQVSGLDAAFLLAQARAMNDELGRANAEELDADETAARRARCLPSSAARGCDDIFEAMAGAKIRALEGEKRALLELRAGEADARRAAALANVRAVAHDAPFKPTEAKPAGGPFEDARPGRFAVEAGFASFNDAKRGFFASYDSNKHTTTNQLLDHHTRHVDRVNHSIIHHGP